jgi:RND superfamily putative drug exporter
VFARLGRWCHRRRGTVVLAWIAAVVVGVVLTGIIGQGYSTQFDLPDVESARGLDIMEANFPEGSDGEGGTLVFRAEQGVTDPAVQQAMTQFFTEVAAIDTVANVTSPFSPEGAQQVSQDGTVAFARVGLPRDFTIEEAADLTKEVKAAIPDEVPGLEVELGGQVFADFEPPSSETLGLAFAIIVLILAFGSVLAMGLPVGTALAGIGVGTIIAGLLSNIFSMPDFASVIGIMIGLGVGIDYALFIVTRYRENVHHGASGETATAVAIDTAGRAVVFAGTTVVISLMGMLVMNVAFVSGMAIGAATVVAVTAIASITLLPALLGYAGDRIELTRWRGLIAAGLVAVALIGLAFKAPALYGPCLALAAVVLIAGFFFAPLKKEVPKRAPKPLRETTSYRWSRIIQHHPWPAAITGVVILVVLALPFLGLRMGFSDEGNYAEDTTTRKAYDLIAEGFGPGFNGPLILATEIPAGTDPATLDQVTQTIQGTEGVAFASPAQVNEAGTAARWFVTPETAPQDEATTNLVNDLRDDVLPAATEGTGLDIAVTGNVAINVDFSEYLGARLPYFFAVVLGLSFLLLMVVFRSLLVPLKAVIMNLLSIGAAYGLVVAIFQWGWGGSLLGIEPAPIEPFVPMMMFAIVFGLSMDYEVFLLSRIREEYLKSGDSRRSVADGLAATARVITAAAAIMVVVFGSFLLENDRVIKLFGIGLASAVFLDATVVRMLLVPATMELLGDKNWWLPRWLDKLLPKIDVEGHADLDTELEELTKQESSVS